MCLEMFTVRRRSRSTRPSSVNRKLFAANATLGYETIRLVSELRGEQLVKERKARRVYSGDVFLGYQLAKSTAQPKMRESGASPCGLTAADAEAVAGLHGESFTVTLTERERMRRVQKGLAEMDFVEAAGAKLAHYRDGFLADVMVVTR